MNANDKFIATTAQVDEAAILRWPNRLAALLPADGEWAGVVHVADPAPDALTLYADATGQRLTVTVAADGDRVPGQGGA